jgi:protein-tyrosine-phosphatase
MRTVLYVCSGNTCRSPIAEAITRHWLSDAELGDSRDVFVCSAGTSAMDGAPLSPETLRALTGMGIHHRGTAKALTAEMIRKADVVLCMTAQHEEAARALVTDEPEHAGKVQRLDPAHDIEDPIGSGQEAYDALAERLERLIPRRLKESLGVTAAAGRRAPRRRRNRAR